MIDLPPPSYEQTIEAIVQCGIPRANIRIVYEDYLQSDEVTISDLGTLTESKMRCLRSAVHPFYILTLADQKQQSAFYEFSEREDRPKLLADAREWVRSRGWDARIPSFDPGQGVEVFARDLETACQLRNGSAVAVLDPSTLTIRPDFIRGRNFDVLSDDLQCLTKMFAASNATELNLRMVFVGNGAVSESLEK